MRKFLKIFNLAEWLIWGVSVVAAIISFFVFKNTRYHYLVGSIIGFTALIFVSKGNPLGLVLTIVFSVFYGVISYSFAYYGEMITYLGMSTPMAVAALIAWIRNPYNGNRSQVKVNNLSKKEWGLFSVAAVGVTVAFYFILQALNTANLIISTISVFTSFIAAYLNMRRNKFYAVAYGFNDIVLIVMWVMASVKSITYLPMVVCFAAFMALDIYGFINWSIIEKRQIAGESTMFEKMRRFKQELDKQEVWRILQDNTSGVLAVVDGNGYPYALPLSYVYADGKIYFHSAKTGHKIDAIKNCKKASFCVIDKDDVQPEKYTTYYKSVIAFGSVEIVENAEESFSAIKVLGDKYYPGHDDELHKEIEKCNNSFVMIRFDIEHATGKQAVELLRK